MFEKQKRVRIKGADFFKSFGKKLGI